MDLNSYKNINIRELKDYFFDDTYLNLINAIDAYEKQDYITFIIWAAVFNERLINDLTSILRVETKSKTIQGLKRSISSNIHKCELDDQKKLTNLLETSSTIQNIRNTVVHHPSKLIDEPASIVTEVYGALLKICWYYIQTYIVSERKKQNNENSKKRESNGIRIDLTNIGKINRASIKIDGLTVIVGENATGKSTVGKSLYLITNSLKKMGNRVSMSQIENIEQPIRKLYWGLSGKPRLSESAENMVKVLAECHPSSIRDILIRGVFGTNTNYLKANKAVSNEIERVVEEITQIRSLSYNELGQQFVTNEIARVFSGKICKIGTQSGAIEIIYSDGNHNSIRLKKGDNEDECIEIIYNQEIVSDTCMIDDNYKMPLKGQMKYEEKDVINSYHAKKLSNQLSQTLSSLVKGRIVLSENNYYFEQEDLPELIEMNNLSDGVKAIAQLEWILRQGEITRDGILILDEPELRLHPEWQIKYAQIIVQLQKQLGLYILLITHSPYFLQALEYSAKLQGLGDKYHCYLAESNNEMTRISCVDSYPSYAYKKMIESFVKLDEMREEVNNREKIGDTTDEN